MNSLIRAQFRETDGGLLLVEDPNAYRALVETGTWPEGLEGEVPEDGRVAVGLESVDTTFVGYDTAAELEAFLRSVYLLEAEGETLTRVDSRPLYDLLPATLPTVRGEVRPIRYRELVSRSRSQLLGFGRLKTRVVDSAEQALARGASFCGMLSVCARDGEPLCASTYAWMAGDVCLFMATHDGGLSFELFPFRVVP